MNRPSRPNQSGAVTRRPNILLMISHDIGKHLGCCGIETVRTPNLDRLAADGVRFDNCFCTAPQCSPSRASLMTGRYPHSNGVMGLANPYFKWSFSKEQRPMVNVLAENGYETYLFGLQHATHDEEFLAFKKKFPGRECRKVADDVVRFINEREELGGTDGAPFFAHVGFFEPHRPFDHGGVEADSENGVFVPPFLPDTEEARTEFALYQGAIHTMDAAVGRIVDTLATSHLSDNTIIFFLADHGMPFPRAKCTLYDPGIEIACIVNVPEKFVIKDRGHHAGDQAIPEQNTSPVRHQLISNIDIFPTLLDAAGIKDHSFRVQIQGRSFWPLLDGGMQADYSEREAVFAEKTYHNYYDPMRGIRTKRYKLIYNFESTPAVHVPGDVASGPLARSMSGEFFKQKECVELYDLEKDPLERINLAFVPDYQSVRNELLEKLRSWMEETHDPIIEDAIPSPAYLYRKNTFYGMVDGSVEPEHYT